MFGYTPAMRRMLKARSKIAQQNAYFATAIYELGLKEDENCGLTDPTGKFHPTMATDGINIYFHPDFVSKHDQDDKTYVEGVFLHEVLHCVADHMGRRDWREPQLANIAADYAINPLVKSVYELPGQPLKYDSSGMNEGHLDDPRFHGMNMERIYNILDQYREKQQQKNQCQGQGQGQGKPSEGKPGKGDPSKGEPQEKSGRMRELTAEEQAELSQKWEQIARKAADKARQAGNVSANLRIFIDSIMPSEKIDYKTLLDDMIRNAKSKINGAWQRPNRRMLSHGHYFPGNTNDNIYRLVVCFDTSGSVCGNPNWFVEMKAEAMTLMDQGFINRVTLIATDTSVCNVADVSDSKGVEEFELRGGGGTQFDAAMRLVGETKDAVGCVFFTDMETSSFGQNPNFPVVWVNWGGSGQRAPFGSTVKYG